MSEHTVALKDADKSSMLATAESVVAHAEVIKHGDLDGGKSAQRRLSPWVAAIKKRMPLDPNSSPWKQA